MSRLAFRRIRIDRFLGINSSFELRELASGINVIYGPNASGKTTTARAIELLLWPKASDPRGAVLEASVDLANDTWIVRINADRADYEQAGLPVDHPMPTVPAEGRDRYQLWLTDLLQKDDEEFARRIIVESAGGYDLRGASNAAFASWKTAPRRGKPHDDLLKARKAKADATAAAAALEEERTTLAEKEDQLARRDALIAREKDCQLALDRARLRDALVEAKSALDLHPPILAALLGNEAAEVRSLRVRIEEARKKLEAAEVARMTALRKHQELRVPREIFEGDLLQRLTEDVKQLGELDRTIEELERHRATEVARVADVDRRFGNRPDRDRLAELNPEGLGNLLEAGRRAEESRRELAWREQELRRLPENPPPADLRDRDQGIHILREWLASGPGGGSELLRRAAMAGVLVLLVSAIVLLTSGPVWLGVPVLLTALAVGALLYREQSSVDFRPDVERRYAALGLVVAPGSWEAQAVESCLAALEVYVAEGRKHEQAWERGRTLRAELNGLRNTRPEPDALLQELAGYYGLRLPDDTIVIYSFVEDLVVWRKALTALRAAEAELVAVYGMRQEVLESANQRFRRISRPTVKDSQAVKGAAEKLREDLVAYREASRELDDAKNAITAAEELISESEAALAELRARAGFEEVDEPLLADWCAQLPARKVAAGTVALAEGQLKLVEQRIGEVPGFDSDLLTLHPRKLESEISRLSAEAGELQNLAQAVGALKNRIEAARGAHTLEDALVAEREALAGIEGMRERSVRSAVAEALVAFVDRETRRAHQPRVLQRANELLGVITRHGYELVMDDQSSGSFRAIDRQTGRGHSLRELSSGTRVQLLLAVRLAFVESLEAGVSLPLLMDETLANSDDERAAAIMEAVVRLAEAGRQVFYFTAQPDEVSKWVRTLQGTGVEWKQVDLAELRALEGRLDPSFPEPEAPPAPALLPPEVKHAAIPGLIPVPALKPDDPVSRVHPWYLTEDTALLRFLINDLRVTNWGVLNALLEETGEALLEPSVREPLTASAHAARSILAALKIGRGARIDRAVLVESKVLSARYLEEIDQLCTELDGDGARLIAALEGREVKGFRQKNVDDLRAYLEGTGHHDTRSSLDFEQLRQRVLTDRSRDIATGMLTVATIDGLISRLARGMGIKLDPPPAPEPQMALFL
ncbi:MAG: AAA family ATPase [Gemmatimonadota bacterium]|jgi:energy-coupling factor transporter ATP-binding protein EcfA2|nr:AAA family ATPase [Gemmatimonadota bacterium]